MNFNPWHNVNIGSQQPDVVQAIIEIPKGSKAKLPPHFISEMKHFFEEYKTLENKKVLVEDFQNVATAKKIIQTAIEDYQYKFK